MKLIVNEQDLNTVLLKYLDEMNIKHEGKYVSMRFIGGRKTSARSERNPSYAEISITDAEPVHERPVIAETTSEEITNEELAEIKDGDLPVSKDLEEAKPAPVNIFRKDSSAPTSVVKPAKSLFDLSIEGKKE